MKIYMVTTKNSYERNGEIHELAIDPKVNISLFQTIECAERFAESMCESYQKQGYVVESEGIRTNERYARLRDNNDIITEIYLNEQYAI